MRRDQPRSLPQGRYSSNSPPTTTRAQKTKQDVTQIRNTGLHRNRPLRVMPSSSVSNAFSDIVLFLGGSSLHWSAKRRGLVQKTRINFNAPSQPWGERSGRNGRAKARPSENGRRESEFDADPGADQPGIDVDMSGNGVGRAERSGSLQKHFFDIDVEKKVFADRNVGARLKRKPEAVG